MSISQSTHFVISQLSITSRDGSVEYDIRGVFEELNIHDNIMFPCMSGSVLITDAVGLTSKIKFDGSEYLSIKIQKDPNDPTLMWIDKKFIIYKQTNRSRLNQASEMYVLNFVSEEFILSEQKKVRQIYNKTRSDAISNILSDYLHVDSNKGFIEQTSGIHDDITPNLSPLDTIERITKRSVSYEGLPDYLFWQTQVGFNFASLSTIVKQPPIITIETGAKNLAEQNISDDIYGARDIKVISQFDMAENIQSGAYAGKFIGYDILNRKIMVKEISGKNTLAQGGSANPNRINSSILNEDNKTLDTMFDSRVVVYPFQESRKTTPWFQKNDPNSLTKLEDTHQYMIQRQAILQNFMQKRLRITMSGNFRLWSGENVQVNVPSFTGESNPELGGDKSLTGKYTIIGTRHIIRFDKHETIIEVATDSTNLGT